MPGIPGGIKKLKSLSYLSVLLAFFFLFLIALQHTVYTDILLKKMPHVINQIIVHKAYWTGLRKMKHGVILGYQERFMG